MDRTEMLEKVRVLCEMEEIDAKMEYCFDSALNTVKNYCGIDEIVPGLETVVIDMTVEIYTSEGVNAQGTGTVKSISEGDVSVDFGSSTGEKYGISDVRNYEKRMKPFRRIKWK